MFTLDFSVRSRTLALDNVMKYDGESEVGEKTETELNANYKQSNKSFKKYINKSLQR